MRDFIPVSIYKADVITITIHTWYTRRIYKVITSYMQSIC